MVHPGVDPTAIDAVADADEPAPGEPASPGPVAVGDRLPPFRRVTGPANWNRYGAVNDEFADMHIDDDVARAAGYPSAIGQGYLQWSYLHNLIRDWIGPAGEIRRAGCRFLSYNVKGQVLTARGTVTAVDDQGDRTVIDLDVWVEDDAGVRLATGSASVTRPAPGAARPGRPL